MNRLELIKYCEDQIFPQVAQEVKQDMDLIKVIKMVSRWRIGKPIDIQMVARVDDGFLFINDDPVGRIARRLPKVQYSPEAGYWEGKILADHDL